MKAALYIRVSSQEQHAENQLPALHGYCQQRGYEVSETYAEEESAWRGGHQKELSRLMSDLESGRRRYAAIVCWSLDRLTREGIGTLLTLYSRFTRLGCKVLSVQESWTEMPNEMTPLFLAMIGFFAKWESDRRSERTKAGLARVRLHGSRTGRGIGQRGPDKRKRRRAGYLARWSKQRGGSD